jgi:hypothetical protein
MKPHEASRGSVVEKFRARGEDRPIPRPKDEITKELLIAVELAEEAALPNCYK